MLLSLIAVYFMHRRKWFHWDETNLEQVGGSLIVPWKYLFTLRLSLFCVILGTLIAETIIYDKQYQYYTVWNYTLLGGYFLLSAIVTGFYGMWSRRRVTEKKSENLRMHHVMIYVARFTWIIQQTLLILSFLVDIVYWSAVFSKGIVISPLNWYVSLSNHLLNLVFIYGDFLIGQTRFRYAHIIFAMIFSELFMVFQWIYVPITDIWVYPILDVESPYAILWYIGLTISLFVFSGIAYGVDALKQRCLSMNNKKMMVLDKLDIVETDVVVVVPSKEFSLIKVSEDLTEKQRSVTHV